MQKTVQVQEVSGNRFMPVLYWGVGIDMDREAYGESFDSIQVAERVAQRWADEQGAAYRPYQVVDREALLRETQLIRRLREEEGLDLRAAIRKARDLLKTD
jgi:hypothetical protein